MTGRLVVWFLAVVEFAIAREDLDEAKLGEIFEGSQSGDATAVHQLLESGTAANLRDHDNDLYSPLHYAAEEGHVEVVRELLAHGAALEARTRDEGSTALHLAVLADHALAMEELLLHGAAVNAPDLHLSTPLHTAAWKGQRGIVEKLLWHGASVNARSDDGRSPLHSAAGSGHTWVVTELLKKDAAVDVRDHRDETPLHSSARSGGEGVVKVLVEHGAAVNARDATLRTPLHVAAEKGHSEAAAELLALGTEAGGRDRNGDTPLTEAARYGRAGVLRLLLRDAGADALEQTDYGKTAYEVAEMAAHSVTQISAGQLEVLAVLREHGGDPDLATRCAHAIRSDPRSFMLALTGGLALGAVARAAVAVGASKSGGRSGPGEQWPWLRVAAHDLPPIGARVLAAQRLIKQGRGGSAKVLLWKLYRVLEVFLNLVLVFGPCMYHRTPWLVLPAWLTLWALPAGLHFGLRELLLNPVLVVSSGRSRGLQALASLRFLAMLYAAQGWLLFFGPAGGGNRGDGCDMSLMNNALRRHFSCDYYVQVGIYNSWAWQTSATVSMDTIMPGPWGSASTKPLLANIDMAKWFLQYERAVLALAFLAAALGAAQAAGAGAGAGALGAGQGGPAELRRQVQSLASKAVRAGTAVGVTEIGLRPVVWYPRPSTLDLGLASRVLFLINDIILDVNVMLNLLSRQYYAFFGVMLFIFTSSIIGDVFQRQGLCSIRHDFQVTVAQGYLTEGLLSLFYKEAGWEAFGQLAVTTYALAFLTHEPLPLLTAMLSLLTSSWTLGSHLFQLIDLGEVMAGVDEDQKGAAE